MARMTRAEKMAAAAAERARQSQLDAEAYLPRLMTALESATNQNNYELTVLNAQFHLRDRDSSYDRGVALSPVYTESSFDALESLEWDLKQKAEARAEAERKYLVKQAALAKLSKEERELLGL